MKTKTIKILNLVLVLGLSMYRTKQITFDLPDDADDVSVTHFDTKDNVYKVKYYRSLTGSVTQYIDLPKCKRAGMISLTPMYYIYDGTKQRNYNRKIVVSIDY